MLQTIQVGYCLSFLCNVITSSCNIGLGWSWKTTVLHKKKVCSLFLNWNVKAMIMHYSEDNDLVLVINWYLLYEPSVLSIWCSCLLIWAISYFLEVTTYNQHKLDWVNDSNHLADGNLNLSLPITFADHLFPVYLSWIKKQTRQVKWNDRWWVGYTWQELSA